MAPAPITPIEINLYAAFEPTTFFRTFRHATVQVNGIKLHYMIGGEGEPVVLLNGYPETWYGWRKIMPAPSKQLFHQCTISKVERKYYFPVYST